MPFGDTLPLPYLLRKVMTVNKGLIGQVLNWFTHPLNSDGSLLDWTAGLVLVIIVAFLWTTVLRQIE